MQQRLALTILGVLVLPTGAGAKLRDTPATLAQLAERTVSVDRAAPVAADAALAAEGYRRFLELESADPALRAQALRRLGDLGLAAAVTLDANGGSSESVAAEANAAVDAYLRLLQEFPDHAQADTVNYQLARAHEAAGRPEESLATLDRLVAQYPHAAQYDEAQFRRGEAAFVAGRYAEAGRAYAAVLARASGSEFETPALYKQAWSLFRQSRDEESRASFLALLDRILGGAAANPQGTAVTQGPVVLSRADREYADDALRALAVGFAASDGLAALTAALAAHGPAVFEAQLYRALGDLYVEQQRYQDAAQAYDAFARRDPQHAEAPLLLIAAVAACERGGFAALVLEGKRALVIGYGPDSDGWTARHAGLDPRVEQALRSYVLDLAQHHHALAQAGSGNTDLDAAVRWYRVYLLGFDAAPGAQATRLLLADLLFDAGRHVEAAPEYERAAYGYPLAAESARAAYASLVAFEKGAEAAPAAERGALSLRAVPPSLRFATSFPDHAQVPAVLTRSARTLFDAGDTQGAESVAARVLAHGTRANAEQQLQAWRVLAHVYFDSGRYAQAESAYAQVLMRMAVDDAARDESVERLAASIYRQAEARRTSGDTAGAVQDFLRVAAAAPGSTIRATAQYDAAAMLLAGKDWQQAAQVLRDFRRDHPADTRVAEVTRQLAVAYLESGQRREAALELEAVALDASQPDELRRTAQWQAAEVHASASDAAGAQRAYGAYVQRYPLPLDAAMDARAELADLAQASGDSHSQRRWLEEMIAADAAAADARSERSRYLAAHAALELALPMEAATRAITLSTPLDRSLLARKAAMEVALAALGRAADYGIADVTSRAVFAMAELYRDLGRALLASQRPADLDAEALEQYTLLLEEHAFPFEENAIALHERNARLGAEGLHDASVQRSLVALAELKPARYARTELRDGPPADADALAGLAAAAPADASLQNRLGVAFREAGRLAEARAAYERAIAADPAAAAPHRNLAVLLDLYLGDSGAALAHYEHYQALTGGVDAEAGAWLLELRNRLERVPRTAEVKP